MPRSFFISMLQDFDASMFRSFEASKNLYDNRLEASSLRKMKSNRVKPHSEEPP